MAKDFSKFLNTAIEEHEAPKVPPIGHYYATIRSQKIDERDFGAEHGKRVLVTLTFKLTAADSDVEEPISDKELAAAIVTKDYALNGDRPQGHMLRTLAEKTLGLNVTGQSFGEVLEAIVGHDVKVYIEHRNDKNDPERIYADVKKVLPATGE